MVLGSGTTWKLASVLKKVAPEATICSTCVSENGAPKLSGPEALPAAIGNVNVPVEAMRTVVAPTTFAGSP